MYTPSIITWVGTKSGHNDCVHVYPWHLHYWDCMDTQLSYKDGSDAEQSRAGEHQPDRAETEQPSV